MGGRAFDPEGISTPRMPPEIYLQVRERMLRIFRQHFRHAHSPIEAPAKDDHGDIDILVTEPIDPKAIRNPEYLASLVGAKRWKKMRGSDTTHLAVPWPASDSTTPKSLEAERLHSNPATRPSHSNSKLDETTGLPFRPNSRVSDPDKFIQLDISILSNHTTLSWLLFLHAHGDFWSILGSLLRRYGLTCTPSGFYLHIPEIEGQNKSLSRVKVTDDPGLVLKYLGLDEEKYWRGFGSWDELLGYACECRFVDLGRGKRRQEHERREREEMQEKEKETGSNDTSLDQQNASSPDDTATPENENGGPPLKSDDRQKVRKRPLFSYFITTYIDAHSTIDTPPGSAAKLTKQEVAEDAKAFFGEDFAKKYEEARKKGMEVVGVQGLWSNIRNMIKEEGGEGDELGYGMKGVKDCICGKDFEQSDIPDSESPSNCLPRGSEGIDFEAVKCAREAFQEMRYEEVLEWAKVSWRKVGERQKKIDMEISGKRLAAKLEADMKSSC